MTFAFSRLELIETFAKIVANTSANWRLFSRFFLNDFFLLSRLSCLLKFLWYYDQNKMLWSLLFVYCLFRDVDFHTNDLIELNYYRINVFKNISRMRFVDANWNLFWFRKDEKVFSASAFAHSKEKRFEQSVLWFVKYVILIRIHYNV